MIKPMLNAIAAAAVFASVTVYALDVPGPVVDSAWLEANLKDAVVLDVRHPIEGFDKEDHIPGSRLLDWGKLQGKRTVDGVELIKMVPTADELNALMRALGVNDGDAIVVSSLGKSSAEVTYATRAYWTLKYFNYNNIAVLDGGTMKWIKDGKPVSKAMPEIKPGNFTAKGENTAILATTADVKKAMETGATQLIDARTLDYYLGTAQKPYVSAKGHIPGAKDFPHQMIVYWDKPATFLPAADIESTMKAVGLDTDKPSIIYCNSGHLASGAWFVLSEMLKKSNVTLYDGSMHEWTKDSSLPLVTMKME